MKPTTMQTILLASILMCLPSTGMQKKEKTADKASPTAGVLPDTTKDGEMKKYFLVLLKRGPVRNHDSATAASIQAGHLANIDRLYADGKIDIAGPFGHDGDIRGIFIFNCGTYEEVLAHCTTDPAIKAGRLIADIYPWWGAKGARLR